MRPLRLGFATLILPALAACSADARPAKSAPEPAASPATAAPAAEEAKPSGQGTKLSSADASPDADLAVLAQAEATIGALSFGDAQKKEAPPAKAGGGRAMAAEKGEGGNACASACNALGSMSRATDHLCSLAGESDARCSDARKRTKNAETRVKGSCSC